MRYDLPPDEILSSFQLIPIEDNRLIARLRARSTARSSRAILLAEIR